MQKCFRSVDCDASRKCDDIANHVSVVEDYESRPHMPVEIKVTLKRQQKWVRVLNMPKALPRSQWWENPEQR